MNRLAHPTRRPVPRCRAFTLIEILIVVSILVLLVSLLYGALAMTRKTTYLTACKNNLKQIGNTIMHYRLDDRRYFGLIDFSDGGSGMNQLGALMDYTQSYNMFTCPATSNFIDTTGKTAAQVRSILNANTFDKNGEGKSYESNGAGRTVTSIKGQESQLWFVYDQDDLGTSGTLDIADNHGERGGNVLYGTLNVGFVQPEDWVPN